MSTAIYVETFSSFTETIYSAVLQHLINTGNNAGKGWTGNADIKNIGGNNAVSLNYANSVLGYGKTAFSPNNIDGSFATREKVIVKFVANIDTYQRKNGLIRIRLMEGLRIVHRIFLNSFT